MRLPLLLLLETLLLLLLLPRNRPILLVVRLPRVVAVVLPLSMSSSAMVMEPLVVAAERASLSLLAQSSPLPSPTAVSSRSTASSLAATLSVFRVTPPSSVLAPALVSRPQVQDVKTWLTHLSGLVDGGFRLKDVSNVIFRNLKMSNPPKGKDLIDIESSTYVWVDHCDLSAEGITGDKDHFDGLCDAKRGSDFITISWTKFSDHWKASLIGHSDNSGADDTGKLHVTYHHNYWSNINSRAPSVRFGTAHIYSSCYEDVPTSGVNSRMGAQVLVEQTSFNNVNRAIVTNLDSKEEGFASNKNNIFTNSETQITQEKEFTPPYSYT